jgi:hypothetical protein
MTQLSASPLVLPLFEVPAIPNFDGFGQYPILQFGAVLLAFFMSIAGLLGWKRGERLGKENAANNSAPVAELHFDGPIKGIFDGLSDIKARQLLARLELKDDVALLLSTSRGAIVDVIENCIRDHETAMERRFSDVNTNINSLHARLDDIMKSQAHIEGTMPRRR